MTLTEVMKELAAKGSEQTKKTLRRHGAKEPFFGVKVADLKVIAKKIKGDQALALQLFATGNGDAQYLAGLVVDGSKMTSAQLRQWAETASWSMISNFTVPWAACEHAEGFALAVQWIDSPKEPIACAGWNTLGALAATVPDERLPIKSFGPLLERVVKSIHAAPNDVRCAMNGFVIACGTYLGPLADRAVAAAKKIGPVAIDQGDTACRAPDAASYILKARRGAPVAPKRQTARC